MKSYLYIILSALCLSTIGILVKLIGAEIPIMTLNFYRFFFALIFLVFILPFIDKTTFKLKKSDLKDYILIGFLYAINFCFYTSANLFAPIQNVVLIDSVSVFFIFLFAFFLLKEKITKTKVITLLIAMIGLLIINPFQTGPYFLGNLFALISAVTFGFLVVKLRKEDISHGIGDVFWFFLFAAIFLLPFPFIFGLGNLSAVWLYVILLGVVSTGLAYMFYNLALEKLEAEVVSIISILISPLSAIILALLILNEALSTRTISGGAMLILAGVYLELHKKRLKS